MQLPKLNLPDYSLRIRQDGAQCQVFDAIRRRYVALTPEEWVRQNMVAHLIAHCGFPAARMANEATIHCNGLRKRCDTIVFDAACQPFIIIEYKAPTVALSQKTFDQVATYNYRLNVPYLLLSNGQTHLFCRINREEKCYHFFEELPEFSLL
ncbi:MAG: type I restriction enzyme HsdR N-terminal domain-containing protein [Prevotellaceae bacterium]|jgi:hypothetical protein|nr:type I restriction enzyme HsdR N-terminal domain-containing protein [Prevotellaceae bacterium]